MSTPAATSATGVAVMGPDSERWARALRGIENVTATRAPDTDLMSMLARDDINAVAFVGSTSDLAAAIKRALLSNRHVLVAGTPAISAKQLLALDAQARRRSRVLMFGTGTLGDDRVDFVRKMVSGPQALWRARYVRSLRTGAGDSQSIDELAIADIGFVLSVCGETPARVSAVSPRGAEESGASDIAIMTLIFESGAVARIDVSLVEPEPRHEVALACDGRTVLFDAFNARAPLQIQSASRHRTPKMGNWEETVTEHPGVEPTEQAVRVGSSFIAAVRARDVSASNVRAVALATSVWESARESIAATGAMIDIGGRGQEQRPRLKLIVGGGHIDESYPAPHLEIVSRRNVGPQEPPDDPEPLRTA